MMPNSVLYIITALISTDTVAATSGATSDVNDTVQWVCVIMVVLLAVRWIWHRNHRRPTCSSCGSENGEKCTDPDCKDKKCENRCTPQEEHTGNRLMGGECDGCPLKNNCRH